MATCPNCKTFYLDDECPTCKKERLAEKRKKKPPREAMSMGGWAGWCTFLGVIMCILSFPAFFLASFSVSFSLLFGSMPFFCLGKLFKCITEIIKNQVEILNMLDQEK